MRANVLAMLLAGGLALPGTVLAQDHQEHHRQGQEPEQEMMQQGMMMRTGSGHSMWGAGMMGRPGPGLVLSQKDALSLNESQVERLQALEKQVAETREALVQQIPPLQEQAQQALRGANPDLSRYESALEKLAERQVKAQVEAARLSQQALEVLTPEQRSNVRYTMRMQGGMMRGGMTGDGGCPMMETMEEDNG